MWAEILPFILAASLGFRHAFETDHLVAASNNDAKRNSVLLAMEGAVGVIIIGLGIFRY